MISYNQSIVEYNQIPQLLEENIHLRAEVEQWKKLFEKATKETFDLKAVNLKLKDNISKLNIAAKNDYEIYNRKITVLEKEIEDLVHKQTINNKTNDLNNTGNTKVVSNMPRKNDNIRRSTNYKRRSRSREKIRKNSSRTSPHTNSTFKTNINKYIVTEKQFYSRGNNVKVNYRKNDKKAIVTNIQRKSDVRSSSYRKRCSRSREIRQRVLTSSRSVRRKSYEGTSSHRVQHSDAIKKDRYEYSQSFDTQIFKDNQQIIRDYPKNILTTNSKNQSRNIELLQPSSYYFERRSISPECPF